MFRTLLLLTFSLALLSPALAETVAGQVSVVDGDTLELHGEHIRMVGIDAPESSQTCRNDKGIAWRCGQKAAFALADAIARSTVTCTGDEHDRYGRLLALCRVGELDLSGWMVRHGWAMAFVRYSEAYVAEEAQARGDRVGIWSGTFVPPWDWRRGVTLDAKTTKAAPTGGCSIKGNISTKSGERIYHLPGGPWYDRTKVSESKGERWFCSEQEARAAGWRRAGRR